jgi:hypothetical protein
MDTLAHQGAVGPLLTLLLLPMLHRWYYTYATLQSTPTYTCFVGTTTQAYGNFFGNTSSWSHITTWATYYNTTAPTWHAWSNTYACSSVQPAICEIPVAAYACASTPPPAPAPPPSAPLCEWACEEACQPIGSNRACCTC